MSNLALTMFVLGAGCISVSTAMAAVTILALVDKLTERWMDD